jgi:hypothetical protein
VPASASSRTGMRKAGSKGTGMAKGWQALGVSERIPETGLADFPVRHLTCQHVDALTCATNVPRAKAISGQPQSLTRTR